MNRVRPLHVGAAFALPFLALAGCATDRQVIQQAEGTHGELKPAVIEDAEVKAYFGTLGTRIVDAAKEAEKAKEAPPAHFEKGEENSWMFQSEQFHLVNSKTLNAFTTGGSHLYVYSELLETCKTEDELAAVMSHEFAHVYSRHVQKGMNRQYTAMGVSAGAGLLGTAVGGKEHGAEYASLATVSAATASQFLNLGYTRDDEAEADQYGFRFYARAGWDPAHFGDFFQQLIDKGLDKTPEIESDHPSLASRVKAAHAHAAALPPEATGWRKPPIKDAAAFESFKKHVASVGASMKTSEQLAKAQTLLTSVPSCVTPEDQVDQKIAQNRLAKALQAAQTKPPKK